MYFPPLPPCSLQRANLCLFLLRFQNSLFHHAVDQRENCNSLKMFLHMCHVQIQCPNSHLKIVILFLKIMLLKINSNLNHQKLVMSVIFFQFSCNHLKSWSHSFLIMKNFIIKTLFRLKVIYKYILKATKAEEKANLTDCKNSELRLFVGSVQYQHVGPLSKSRYFNSSELVGHSLFKRP